VARFGVFVLGIGARGDRPVAQLPPPVDDWGVAGLG
jgi:hypothetical protein